MMKIDAEKFLAMTVLLATTAGTPACGKKDEKKADAKTDVAAPAAPAAPATPAPVVAPVAEPPATPPAEVPADDKGASAGGGAAKPDPGPEEEKPSW